MDSEEMEGEEMESKRRLKVQTQFEYSTKSGAICIQIILIVSSVNIQVCVRAEYKERDCGGSI